MSIVSRAYGEIEGKEVKLFTLKNSNGLIAEITNYGGIITSLQVPDRKGILDDIVLGFNNLDGYLKGCPYFGAIIGRHANRIENAEFELNGVVYVLAKNDGDNHLHGGSKGFDKVVWQGEIISEGQNECLQLTYTSSDGEENYPGNLHVKVTYTLTDKNELVIDYHAISDKDTVVNLTNHSYFNLSGHSSGDILAHQIMIKADRFTPVDENGIPTGEIREVKGTPMDFVSLRPVGEGEGLLKEDEQITCGKGYDHNFVLNGEGLESGMVAEVLDPNSGRVMEVYTTKPGIQFYSGNFLDGSIVGKAGAVYHNRSGLCLETQYFSNALKHKHFPSPVLMAGDEYKHSTKYKFLTR